ncbi:hypothetical protein P5673_008711 [Acropora cervicornis]|uniref:Uncharacterized protein n=1 Tax=Acropora cervicornis TaxID=6130 RepID=A0AAD9QT71_ACRCE|nr:hypothetical protein P5673_008711 [Acropora cervicornis]
MMYSLHDITTASRKRERVSGDDGVDEDHETAKSISLTTRGSQRPAKSRVISNDISISRRSGTSSSLTAVENTSARQAHAFGTRSTEGDSINGQPTASVYRNGLEPLPNSENDRKVNARINEPRRSPQENFNPEREREATYRTVWIAGNDQKIIQSPATPQHVTLDGQNESFYRSVWTAGDDLKIYAKAIDPKMTPQQGLSNYQTNAYKEITYAPMASKAELSPYRDLNVYTDTHRSLTSYEMGIHRKPCCNCFCHIPSLSYTLVPEVESHRPSVIMVPAKRDDMILDAPSQMESMTQRFLAQNLQLTKDQKQTGMMDESDSSDDDEDDNEERYFRVNIDGTVARFKLTKEDWEKIPINTFPSGGRLLSGDWTRIFLNKVKESNPWCSLRFKNNHVRSENSRKIHSAVFFRGGAECKRPECNVKVRFVIHKEMGKHVDVTYVGNVCHSTNPGGSDVASGRKRRQARFARGRTNAQE